ncbi:MAG TPA: type I restriction-modification system subunit M N-terminal domain-containing protein [Edaphobacter sp.]
MCRFNPVEVIEQITYLLFLKRLDEVQELEERKAAHLGKPVEKTYLSRRERRKGLPYEDYRWKRFKNAAPDEMFKRFSEAFHRHHGFRR